MSTNQSSVEILKDVEDARERLKSNSDRAQHPPQAETPLKSEFPYFRQSMRDDSDPIVVCTVEHPQGLGVDDPKLDPKLGEKLRAFIAKQLQDKQIVEAKDGSDYLDHRGHAAPADVPSVYTAPGGRIALHWVEDGAMQIRTLTPEWAECLVEWILIAMDDEKCAKESTPFSFKELLGLTVDSVDGAMTIHSDHRLGYIRLGYDDIDRMIAELQTVKRDSLIARGDPVPA